MSQIAVIYTGGTFDKSYNPKDGSLHFQESFLPQLLTQSRLSQEIQLYPMPMIDSLEMDESYRQALVDQIDLIAEDRILIIHGTDTAVETALYIENTFSDHSKKIVLTGAMVPSRFQNSDALFNLGASFQWLNSVNEYGVWLCFHGKSFSPKDCFKDLKSLQFKEKGPQ